MTRDHKQHTTPGAKAFTSTRLLLCCMLSPHVPLRSSVPSDIRAVCACDYRVTASTNKSVYLKSEMLAVLSHKPAVGGAGWD